MCTFADSATTTTTATTTTEATTISQTTTELVDMISTTEAATSCIVFDWTNDCGLPVFYRY